MERRIGDLEHDIEEKEDSRAAIQQELDVATRELERIDTKYVNVEQFNLAVELKEKHIKELQQTLVYPCSQGLALT